MVTLDYRVALLLVDDATNGQRVEATLILEEPFTYTDASGRPAVVDGEDPHSLPPACLLLRRFATSAVCRSDRELLLGFDDGAQPRSS